MQIYLAWTKRRKVMTRPLSIPEKQRFPRSTNLVLRTVGKIAFNYDLGQELAVLGQPRGSNAAVKKEHIHWVNQPCGMPRYQAEVAGRTDWPLISYFPGGLKSPEVSQGK